MMVKCMMVTDGYHYLMIIFDEMMINNNGSLWLFIVTK